MTAPDPRTPHPDTIVRHHLVPPIDTPAEAASRAAWIDQQMDWHRLARPAPASAPGDRFGVTLLASYALWFMIGLVVWAAWPSPTPEVAHVAPRLAAQAVR